MLKDRKGSYPGKVRLASWALAFVVALWSLSGVATAAVGPMKLVGAKGGVALVVGNLAYQHLPSAYNADNDATAMAEALEWLGFDVVLGIGLDRAGFFEKLGEFSRATEKAEVALFFYAGQGSQFEGRDYLTPTDAKTGHEIHYTQWNIKLEDVLGFMRSETRLVFLDASRRFNELGRSLPFRGIDWQVLGGMRTFIAYATAPGGVARAGAPGGNSPFTQALLQYIGEPWDMKTLEAGPLEGTLSVAEKSKFHPDRSLGEIMGLVIDLVRKNTDGRQTPTFSSLGDPFSFYFSARN